MPRDLTAEQMVHFSADHFPDQFRHSEFAADPGVDNFAVAHDGDAVGQFQYFFQPVRNVEDAYLLLPELADHSEQMFRFFESQRGVWLIEHQNASVGRESFRNFNKLLLGQTESTDWHVQIDFG